MFESEPLLAQFLPRHSQHYSSQLSRFPEFCTLQRETNNWGLEQLLWAWITIMTSLLHLQLPPDLFPNCHDNNKSIEQFQKQRSGVSEVISITIKDYDETLLIMLRDQKLTVVAVFSLRLVDDVCWCCGEQKLHISWLLTPEWDKNTWLSTQRQQSGCNSLKQILMSCPSGENNP